MDQNEKRYRGRIKRYYGEKNSGYGFIDCREVKERYGYDTYLHGRQMHGCEVGDDVSFSIVRNAKGEPTARNLCRIKEERRYLAKKERDVEKTQSALQQKRQPMSCGSHGGGTVMSEEEAKAF